MSTFLRIPFDRTEKKLTNLPLILLILLSIPVYLYHTFRYEFPIGSAGLFGTMSEAILRANYELPASVPYYGPGGIVFAYPPLSLYLMAVITQVLDISYFDYMKFVPALLSIACIVVFYLLAKAITSSTLQGLIAALLYMSSADVFIAYTTASGVTRSIACLINLLGLLAFWHAIKTTRRAPAIFAAILFGLTVVTHLSHVIFFILGMVVMGLTASNPKRAIRTTSYVALGGLLIAAPWIVKVIARHGIEPYVLALGTHASLVDILLGPQAIPVKIFSLFGFILFPFRDNPILGGLVIAGLISSIITKKWMLPAWYGLVFSFLQIRSASWLQ